MSDNVVFSPFYLQRRGPRGTRFWGNLSNVSWVAKVYHSSQYQDYRSFLNICFCFWYSIVVL